MIPEQFTDDLVDAFAFELTQDESWRGDLTNEERGLLIRGFCAYLRRKVKRADGFEDEKIRIVMTLRVFAHIRK